MAKTIVEKLRIESGQKLLTIHAPSTFKAELIGLPEKVSISTSGKNYQQIHWFVADSKVLQQDLTKVMDLLIPGVICWVYFPKGSSGIQTDLTRDKGWDALMQQEGIQWITLLSFNATWSVFGIRRKTATDEKKATTPIERAILNWIDAATKTVRLPDELKAELGKNKAAARFFETLSFTNKKEYIEWIVTAKKEETKHERIKGTIDRLTKGWKNPRNI